MAMDLSKQVGPLPLGAWIVVVGGGLGIAYWSYRNNSPAAPEVVEDGSADPGVGTGGSGWSTVDPPPSQSTAPRKPATNDEWGAILINELIARNYPPMTVDSAVRKYLAAERLSVSEHAIIATGLLLMATLGYGSPPRTLPPAPGQPDPPVTNPPVTNPPPPPTNVPGPVFQPPSIGTRVSVPLNKDLYTWTAKVASYYRIQYSLPIMRVLNPGIDRYIVWSPGPTGTYKIPKFRPQGRVPPVRIR